MLFGIQRDGLLCRILFCASYDSVHLCTARPREGLHQVSTGGGWEEMQGQEQSEPTKHIYIMVRVSKNMKRNTYKDAQQERVVYATVQTDEEMSFEAFCRHMATHGSKYSEGEIYAVLSEACSCVEELLLDGKQVSLGSWGKFSPSVSSRPASSYAEFTAENITVVSVLWRKGKRFRNMRSRADIDFVPTREVQEVVRKQLRSGEGNDGLVGRLNGTVQDVVP